MDHQKPSNPAYPEAGLQLAREEVDQRLLVEPGRGEDDPDPLLADV